MFFKGGKLHSPISRPDGYLPLTEHTFAWIPPGFSNLFGYWLNFGTPRMAGFSPYSQRGRFHSDFLVAGWAVSVLFGLANIHFRDTRHLAEIGFQILFYLSPIMYPSSLLMDRGLGWLVRINPVVPFLDLMRIPMLEGKVADPLTWGLAMGISMLCALVASLALRATEDKVILHL